MTGILMFIVLPAALMALAWRIKPLVNREDRPHDPLGGGLAAGGLFGPHGLAPDPLSVREDTEPVKFQLEDVKGRE